MIMICLILRNGRIWMIRMMLDSRNSYKYMIFLLYNLIYTCISLTKTNERNDRKNYYEMSTDRTPYPLKTTHSRIPDQLAARVGHNLLLYGMYSIQFTF